jgi:hypothetical protein
LGIIVSFSTDLKVKSPSDIIYYGNNIKGDELNNVERVVISSPEVGEYSVYVQGQLYVAGECTEQKGEKISYCEEIAIVSTSSGPTSYDSMKKIKKDAYINSDFRQNCEDSYSNLVYIGMASMYSYPASNWGNSTVTVSSVDLKYSNTFSPLTVS